jgi:hypothetical protein
VAVPFDEGFHSNATWLRAGALKAAYQYVNGCDVEVWYLDRKIGRLHSPKE